jgi:L-threonylcarbamoyladenylate synthase
MTEKVVDVLNAGGVVVIPTDTIYGISARALDKKVVEKVHKLKGRSQKPFIILISSIDDLKIFGVEAHGETLKKYWPGKVTIILHCNNPEFEYLHLGLKTLAFRIPDKKDLIEVIKKTGPLISTSVNPEGLESANTIEKAKHYFAGKVDLYLGEGEKNSSPSTIIKIENGKVVVLREGDVKIKLPNLF